MKKNLLFLLFIISFRFVGAQNYRPVVPSQAQFFQVPNSNNNYFGWLGLNYWSPIKVASFDSSVVTTDRIKYFSFHTWADTDQSSGPANVCAYENGPVWMGSQIDELNNGMNYLFTLNNDTVRIQSNALVNDTWNFFDLIHGGHILAHVDSLTWMQQAGI